MPIAQRYLRKFLKEALFVSILILSFFGFSQRYLCEMEDLSRLNEMKRIFELNENEILGDLILNHPQLLREHLKNISEHTHVQVKLIAREPIETIEIAVPNEAEHQLRAHFTLASGNSKYGELTLSQSVSHVSNQQLFYVIMGLLSFLILIALREYQNYLSDRLTMIRPLEKLVAQAATGNFSTLEQDLESLPRETALLFKKLIEIIKSNDRK